ncbi:MAG: 2-oxoacid:acceptor oxidoreductase subunit alpha [Bacteroidales bacterium]|nr:2-oxoacid:acceptor oxidoreductase subunit alpha [Bacteroidales bacterium]
MAKKIPHMDKQTVVVKFAGDSGDGMQLIGTLFSNAAALAGNDLSTFPDYPAEIRAPHNTVAGVSGFQVHVGSTRIRTSGDLCDVLVAMNPASLKANLKWAKKGATVIVDADTFTEEALSKANYASNPLADGSLSSYNLVPAPITNLSRKALENDGLDNKTIDKTRNMFALGMIYYIFDRSMETTCHFFETKFAKKPQMIAINKKVLEAGHHYAEAAEIVESTINIGSAPMEKGRYRNITGNVATAWGLLAAAEKSGRPLFLGSYPITPATDILIEITKRRDLGAKAFQAEDEIAGICSTIGASFAGSLACTSTSGPGLSLMSEALGLAVITELPIVVVDVQRGGPSTGLPTKSEQSDLYQALFGRNGEAPLIVIASSTPANCFQYAYEAAKLAMEHMTPCILLSDGSIGNGSQLFRIPKMADMPAINPPIVPANDPDFKPYLRNPETLVRGWALPGTEGLRHRIGGLEKEDIYGNVSTDPMNHATMTRLRREKVEKIADCIPEQKVDGDADADLLVVSWGGTEGAVNTAVKALQAEGKSIAHAHFNYIMPLPKNTAKVLEGHKKIVVCELNEGQFVNYLRGKFDHLSMKQYNKIQGLPFTVSELTECFEKLLAE